MVKEFAVEGLHQCTVVFDPGRGVHASNANFEHGVTAAMSLVSSAMRAGLTTRFVTAGGIDLRGPEVEHTTQRVLARIEPSELSFAAFDADLTDGIVLLVVVTGSPHAATWRAGQALSDPTMTSVLVTTNDPTNEAAGGSRLTVSARSNDQFVTAWQTLVGRPATSVEP
jgi:uncharacterized protein (DUF58 family)